MTWSKISQSASQRHIYLDSIIMLAQHISPLPMANLSTFTLAHFFCFCVATSFTYSTRAGIVSFTFPPQSNITLINDASLDGNKIQLTNFRANEDLQYSVGWATYEQAVPIWDKLSQALANFATHFKFRITDVTSTSGDGLAFFIASFDMEAPLGSQGGRLGLFNRYPGKKSSNSIVAVEFDTFQNPEFDDPDDTHVGIDVDSIVSKVRVSLDKNVTLNNSQFWDAWVDYDGGGKQLHVFLLSNPSGNVKNISKPVRPILSYDIDLREFLPEKIKVGLSGSVGFSSGTLHTVSAWNFSCEYSWKISTAASPIKNPRKRSKKTSIEAILMSLFACFSGVFCVMLLGGCWYLKVRQSQTAEESGENLDEYISPGPHKFSYTELSVATRNFSDDEKLGEGGFGAVYKGILPATNEAVAVKRISASSKQGKKEYISEVTIISKLRHRNLVQLLGWCHEKGELLLVYEYLAKGSLDQYIYGKDGGSLDWDSRYSIAGDIASALVYLHEDWNQRVVHRDVKASNVMLDSCFSAKLGDFGLARVVERNKGASHTTVVAGTLGYIAPECVITGKASPESDVFSFGAVTLEIACGRRSVDCSLNNNNCRLVEWVWALYGEGKLLDAADEKLGGNFNVEQMERLLMVGLLCSHPDPKARPTMREALKIFNLETELPYVPHNFPVVVNGESQSIHVRLSPNDVHRNMSCSLLSGPQPRT